MLFDSHTHLDDPKFDSDRDEVIENIKNSGVTGLVNVGCNLKTSEFSVKLAEKYDFIYASAGFHPCDVGDICEDDILKIAEMTKNERVVAIGEIGLDYYWDDVSRDVQKYWFLRQLKLAEELDMPVIIHNRDAHKDVLDILKKSSARGIIHCYSASAEMVDDFLSLGYYISFAGPLTYKNNKKTVLAAKKVPLDRILIETDAPYLSPDGFRGKRNDSSKIIHTCRFLADLRGLSVEEMACITEKNAKEIYRIGK